MLRHIRQNEVVQHFYDLAQECRSLLQARSTERLDVWLNTAAHSTLPKVRTFTKALRDEYVFLRAALENEWSNGQTEGQITRQKFRKRQTYGRASFELFARKFFTIRGVHKVRKTRKINGRFAKIDGQICQFYTGRTT